MAAKAQATMDAIFDAIGDNDVPATVSRYLETGFPPLNFASTSDWGRGLPVGRLIEIAGPPSSGKTAIATKAMIAAQEAGGVAGFMDHERSFDMNLGEVIGLDTKTRGRFIYKKPETFEQSVATFQLAVRTIRENKLIPKDAPICWVFDSLAAMVPHSVLYDSKGNLRPPTERNMNDNSALSRATSAHFPAIAQTAETYDVCVIFLNQFRNKIGVVFGDPRKTTGGDSPAFYFSQRIWLSASQIKKDKVTLGMKVTGKFVKNKVSRPFLEATWNFMFQDDGTGRFDVIGSLVDFLIEEKIIPAGTGKGKYDWQGKSVGRDTLVKFLEGQGQAGIDALKALLPARYEPPVVAEVDASVEDVTAEAE